MAFLIIEDYLREDFHYTAYSTISYIQKGPRSPQDDVIEFQPARIYELPPMKELKDFLEATRAEENEIAFVKEEMSPENIAQPSVQPEMLRKRRILSENSSSEDEVRGNLSCSIKDVEAMIDRRVESKLRKILGDNEAGSSADVIVVTPKKETEIIEID